MKVLDVEGHGHEVIRAESAQGKGVLAQGLHVAADGLAEKAEGAQAWKESQQRDDERGSG